MVVAPLAFVLLAMLPQPAASVPPASGLVMPVSVPCVAQLKFHTPSATAKDVRVSIDGRTVNFDSEPGVLTVNLTPETDCGHELQIASGTGGTQKQSFSIEARPASTALPAPQGTSEQLGGTSPAPAAPNYLELALQIAPIVLGLVLLGIAWWILRNLESLTRNQLRQSHLQVALQPLQGGVEDLKIIPVALEKLKNVVLSFEGKLEDAMKVPARADRQPPGRENELYGSRAGQERGYAPIPVAISAPAVPISFEDAYNAAPATHGGEAALPLVTRVLAVNFRDPGAMDKNSNAREPLVANPTGYLRLFFTRELGPDKAYLAPSLDFRAEGVGGTYQRPWASLFDFKSSNATRLDLPAIVRRNGEEYELERRGVMS